MIRLKANLLDIHSEDSEHEIEPVHAVGGILIGRIIRIYTEYLFPFLEEFLDLPAGNCYLLDVLAFVGAENGGIMPAGGFHYFAGVFHACRKRTVNEAGNTCFEVWFG